MRIFKRAIHAKWQAERISKGARKIASNFPTNASNFLINNEKKLIRILFLYDLIGLCTKNLNSAEISQNGIGKFIIKPKGFTSGYLILHLTFISYLYLFLLLIREELLSAAHIKLVIFSLGRSISPNLKKFNSRQLLACCAFMFMRRRFIINHYLLINCFENQYEICQIYNYGMLNNYEMCIQNKLLCNLKS